MFKYTLKDLQQRVLQCANKIFLFNVARSYIRAGTTNNNVNYIVFSVHVIVVFAKTVPNSSNTLDKRMYHS